MQEITEKISFTRSAGAQKSFFAGLDPAKFLILGFAAVILAGAALLCLPFASAAGKSTDFLTSLFTATSAVCVTGLVVVDTGTYWSFWGQLIILVLIQTGGLGIMTMATLFFLLMGKRIGFKERMLIKEGLNQLDISGVVKLAKTVLFFTFITEGAFAVILASRLYYTVGWPRCLWYGLFHSISAFNNSGFDIFGNVFGMFKSLTAYVDDPIIVFSITTLVIVGGIGFSVVMNISRIKQHKLSVHSWLAIVMTLILIAGGTLLFLLFEWSNTLKPLTWEGKLLASYFQSVTPRTAGFNTVDIAGLRSATQFLLVILMFIGASPGSTGGGIKTTTFGLLLVAIWSHARGKEDVEIKNRRIPTEQVYKALGVALLSGFLVIAVILLLNLTEKASFLPVLFETVSAFGTVGLSMNMTPTLSDFGRILIILTMFVGRLGPLTLAYALAQGRQRSVVRHPVEKILIG
ncbi:MAG: Potassium uptake protein, TrkH family [Desulfotomaculum sp. 46_296]|nr:MAG: Potassium uptake protein, TrkH family [Desulfotomaculum sp. 46_296]HAU31695.1 Trk family potassium uptake protein [Desulfotomaculum sp.]